MNDIFLPGSSEQIKKFLQTVTVEDKQVLVIGNGSLSMAAQIMDNGAKSVIIIVDNNDSLLQERFMLKRKDIQIRQMDYHNTDFRDELFDIVYAQASISTIKRTKIIKEVQRVLKPDGIFCAGEMVSFTEEVPQFILDLWEQSELKPLFFEKLESDYTEKGFNVTEKADLSRTLESFYSSAKRNLQKSMAELTENEKKYHKKLLHKISHESNAYLRLGGDKVIGFFMIIADRNKG